MALNNDTQQPEVEDTQNIEGNNNVTKPTTEPAVDNNKGNEKSYSQKDLDDNAANTRRATEKETKKKLLAQLGLTLEDEEKLSAFKEAYQNSLSDEERRNVELENLQSDKIKLTQDLEEKDYIIKALFELTGKQESDVEKIVKMAKGLKTEDNSIEDAIKEVISMVNPVEPKPTDLETNPMPFSQPLQQPSTTVVDNTPNPFKAGQINLTEQGKLIRTNPELAKKLAGEAGVNLKI